MATQKDIKVALDRAEKIFTSRPSEALLTKAMTVTVQDGIRCLCEEGGRTVEVDMPAVFGGEDAAPNPGFYVRAALGSCNAISYAWAFAKHDIPFTHLAVHVESDLDLAGGLGIEGATRGYPRTRIYVDLESTADPDAIETAMAEAEACTTIGHIFQNGSSVSRELRLNQRHQAAE